MKIAIKKNTRAAVLGGALVVTLIATVVSGREKPGGDLVVPASERAAAQLAAPQVAVADEDLDLDRLQRAKKDASIGELFARDVEPAQQAAGPGPGAGTPAKPVEPQLPFAYLGRIIEEGNVSVFLARGDEPIVAKPGQSLEQFRLDEVTDTTLSFTHVPSGARKVLQIAAQN
jgi:hypothetical protein